MASLAGNQIPAAFSTLGPAAALIRAGRLRAIGLTSAQRLVDFPDLPTFAESGFPELVAITWFGLSGPAGIPREISTRLNLEVRAALKEPDVRERLRPQGVEPNDLDVEGFTAMVRSETARWAPLAKGSK